MPCCGFACIVAQLLLGVRAIKRVIFGRGTGEDKNLAVEWRLDSWLRRLSILRRCPPGGSWAVDRWAVLRWLPL